ncbi:thermonuclease family protein [Marinobacterium sp. MBR-109]|jgi:endonuclease YncB( thermonuclease family)|uniref:thermonuclease family protein n=1 Tax=Marinobacterium sp. MBR-109 TaxID=3156462 RepID=UPI0033975F22
MVPVLFRQAAIAFLFTITLHQAYAETMTGKVVKVSDGDTITILVSGNNQRKVRLAEIDAPERGQPYGSRATQMLADMVAGRSVQVRSNGVDRYGRTIGRVFSSGRDVNKSMVEMGGAWVYRQYMTDPDFLKVEKKARADMAGLWALPKSERIPPWDWRKQKRKPVISTASSNPSTCGTKSTCGEMSNCAEARFYLKSCGLHRLDGDGDGTPCESICR